MAFGAVGPVGQEPMGSKGKPRGSIQWLVSEPMEPMLPYPMEPNDPMCPYPIDQALSSWLGTIQLANMEPIMLKALALIALKTLTSTWSQLGKAYPSL